MYRHAHFISLLLISLKLWSLGLNIFWGTKPTRGVHCSIHILDLKVEKKTQSNDSKVSLVDVYRCTNSRRCTGATRPDANPNPCTRDGDELIQEVALYISLTVHHCPVRPTLSDLPGNVIVPYCLRPEIGSRSNWRKCFNSLCQPPVH